VNDATMTALRIDLAAAFRLTAQFGWHESVGNHYSVAVSPDGKTFLMNPKWQHFESIRASDLQLLNADNPDVMTREDAPDASAWAVHAAIHRARPEARVILHCHPPYTTALSTLADPMLKPIDNNTARFFENVALDHGFSGIADDAAEGALFAEALIGHSVLLMRNHGVIVTGTTIAEAFEDLYFFEKAAQTLLTAYASGQPLNILTDDIARKTAVGWRDYRGMADAHFAYLKTMLDTTDLSYRD
jgi:ribulose-5-phosphate 4-epimerase/fuculose-1-phosphate aldolase